MIQNDRIDEISGLDKALMRDLIQCQWIKRYVNLLITGPTGVGKTWIGCALAQKACREGYTALYLRLPSWTVSYTMPTRSI